MPRFVGGTDIDGREELARVAKNLGVAEATLTKIGQRTVNRTLTRARTFATKDIGSQINLTAKKIKETMVVGRPRGNQVSGVLRVRERDLLLTNFGAKKLARGGVSVKVKRGGPRRKLEDAFFIKLRRGKVNQAGAVGVAARSFVGGATRDRRVARYPVSVFHGPSPAQLFRNITRKRTRAEAARYMRKEFDRQARYELRRVWTR